MSPGTERIENLETINAADKTPKKSETMTLRVKKTNAIVKSDGTIDKNPDSKAIFQNKSNRFINFGNSVQIFPSHIIKLSRCALKILDCSSLFT